MSTLKIGYLTKKFPRFSETFIVNEILGLEAQDVDITVFSRKLPDDGRFHPAVSRLRNGVVYLSDGRSDALGNALAQHRNTVNDCLDRLPAALRWVYQYTLLQPLGIVAEALTTIAHARRLGLKHLHVHFASDAAVVAHVVHLLSGIPYSFTAHAKDLYREGIDRQLFRDKVAGARFVITVCDANVDHIRQHLAGDADTPVIRLYNGIDLEFFRPAASANSNGVHGAPAGAVVAVGRLVPKKGFEVLLEAAAILKQRGLHHPIEIIGDGELQTPLRARAAELGVGDIVSFTGALTQPEVLAHLQRASVATLPCVIDSDGNRDALPTSLLESMGVGLPLISTPVGGVGEILVDGKTGWLVEPGSARALADAIHFSKTHPELTQTFGAAGRRRAEELFDVRKNTATLRALFEQSASVSPA